MRNILLAVGLVAVALILLSIGIVLRKDGRFSSQHISESPAMRKRGIGCVVSEDRKMRQIQDKKLNVKEL